MSSAPGPRLHTRAGLEDIDDLFAEMRVPVGNVSRVEVDPHWMTSRPGMLRSWRCRSFRLVPALCLRHIRRQSASDVSIATNIIRSFSRGLLFLEVVGYRRWLRHLRFSPSFRLYLIGAATAVAELRSDLKPSRIQSRNSPAAPHAAKWVPFGTCCSRSVRIRLLCPGLRRARSRRGRQLRRPGA